MRRLVVILMVLAVMLVPQNAWGIVYGEPDNGAHPNVGSFVVVFTNPETGEIQRFQSCTGTLISPTVVVSASHCFTLPRAIEVFLTFDEVIDGNRDGQVDPDVNRVSGRAVTHPLFGAGGQNDPHDVAVFLLDAAVTDIEPAGLPPLGMLNRPEVRAAVFTAVGYGAVRQTNRGGLTFSEGWRRERAEQQINSVTKSWVTFSMNLATGNGGTCYGDSGGPHFRGDVTVSVTVTGDTPCKATDKTYRLDTVEARDFLDEYVTLP